MRNKGYVKRETVIDVQIRDEYFVTAEITPINDDKTEFRYKLSIHNAEAGLSIETDIVNTLSSTYKTVNKDITAQLNNLIDGGFLDDKVRRVEIISDCLYTLLELQNRIAGVNKD